MNIKQLIITGLALVTLVSCDITCDKDVSHYMTLSTSRLDIPCEGSTVTFDLKTNVYVRVNNDCEFASIIDETTVGDVTTYTLKVNENTVTKARSSQIRFIGDHVTPLKLKIEQDPVVPTGIDPTELTIGAGETTAVIKVYGDKEWTVSCDNPNVTYSPAKGKGDADVTLTLPENQTEEPVKAIITVTMDGKPYTCNLTQNGLPKKVYTDLSAAATANCYIVSQPGYYKFKATVCGNGVVPASQTISSSIAPASVKLLWCTFNTLTAPTTDDAVISNLQLDNDYVKFQTSDLTKLVEGNAVIAACDASGFIIWSWQIWVVDEPSYIDADGTAFMDRNLGALSPSAYLTEDPLACGMLYQWGRKDPFPGAGSLSTDNEVMATTGTWPAETMVDESHHGLDFSIKNPMTFLYSKNKNYNSKDWFWGEQYNDLWGGGAEASAKTFTIAKTNKTMFDPCPVGYCIPTSMQYATVATKFGITKTSIAKYGIGNDGFWLVYGGGRLYDSGKLGGPVGEYSWYATTCTNSVNMLCTRSHTTACNFGGATSARTCGYSVRCVKE